MSKETEKVFKELHKYIDEHSDENRTQEDVERLMNEFMTQYNSDLPEPVTEETAQTADDYLELSYDASNRKDALKYAKKALKLDPNSIDAQTAVIEISAKSETEMVRDYARAVQKATKSMEKEGYFEEEYIGDFWGVLETRPYMRLRAKYIMALVNCGMIGQARDECEEMLRLCEGDNLGMRYRLMHIYTYFEDEDAALSLHKRFDSYDETEMLLPLSLLYYKKGDYAKSTQYLRKLSRANKDLKKFLRIYLGYDDEDFDDMSFEYGYRPGTIEELELEERDNEFLFETMDAYMEWALEQIKKYK